MLINNNDHTFMLNASNPEFKLDFLQLGGAIKTYHTDAGGTIWLHKVNGQVIVGLNNCEDITWKCIVNEIKKWCELKHRVYLEEKKREKKHKGLFGKKKGA